MSCELPRLRSLLGASAALWAGEQGTEIKPDRWSALSGARSVDYNVVLCHGDAGAGGLEAALDEIASADVPAVAMVAGPALGEVQKLVELGWVCIGSVPFMRCEVDRASDSGAGSGPQRLGQAQLDGARRLVADVFEVESELAEVAIPRDAADRPGQSVWGVFDETGKLVSCLAAVRSEEIVAIWSMATAPGARRRGHGAALLRAALADAAAAGAHASLLYASPEGEAFYLAFGYRVLERWQLWSRPRWVLGRA